MKPVFDIDKIWHVLSTVTALVLTQPALAGHADSDLRAFGGTVACGGNHFNRVDGTEAHRSRYILRNYNPDQSIFVERMRFFDAQGNSQFDSDVSGLPNFLNNVLGPGDNALDPNQTARLGSSDILSGPLDGNDRPIQAIFTWTADKKILVPEITLVRIVRERFEIKDLDGNVIGEVLGAERARHLYECRHIVISKGKGQNCKSC